jgi:hypothetical protein
VSRVAYHWWWRPGWRPGRRFYTVHATFSGAPAVQALAAKARDRLAGLPGLGLIPAQWLHLTMQGIGFADEVSDADLSAIITAAKARLAAVPPVTVVIGPPAVAGEGVLGVILFLSLKSRAGVVQGEHAGLGRAADSRFPCATSP